MPVPRIVSRMRLEPHWRVFTIVAAAVGVASMDAGMLPILFHGIHEAYPGTAATTLSWVFTAYTIGLAAFVVASGRLSDRTGRRRMFLIGVAVFVLGSLGSGLAPTPALLIVARFVEGTGHALFTPASLGLILAVWPERRRTEAIAAWIAAGGIASGIGPTVGAAIDQFATWRWAFALNALIGLAVLVRARRDLVDTELQEDTSLPDPVGIVLLSVTLGLLALVIVEGQSWGWTDPKILASAAACVVLGAWFARRSGWHPSPVLDPALMRSSTYRISLVVSTLVAMAMMANLVMQAQFLQEAWQYGVLKAGLAVTPLPVLAAVTAPAAGRLAERFGHRNVILVGVAMTAVGLFAYSTLPDESPNYFTGFLPGVALAGIGTWGLAISMINAAAVADMSVENFGVGTAVLQTARQTGGILGVALFFGFYGEPAAEQAFDSFSRLWMLFAVLPAIAFAIALRLPRDVGRAPAPAVAV